MQVENNRATRRGSREAIREFFFAGLKVPFAADSDFPELRRHRGFHFVFLNIRLREYSKMLISCGNENVILLW